MTFESSIESACASNLYKIPEDPDNAVVERSWTRHVLHRPRKRLRMLWFITLSLITQYIIHVSGTPSVMLSGPRAPSLLFYTHIYKPRVVDPYVLSSQSSQLQVVFSHHPQQTCSQDIGKLKLLVEIILMYFIQSNCPTL